MKFGIQNSKFGIREVLACGAVLVLAACSEMGERDNPLDPSASNYVGSDTIINADDNGDSSDSRNDASSSSVNESSSVSSSSSTKNSSSNSEKTEISYGNFTDERDNQVYKTIKIGNQVWMAENLNYKAENSYCYDDKDSYCDRYGRLYVWNSAVNACPEGWHLPTKAEWKTLFDFVGGDDVAGEKLKSADGSTNWYKKSSDAYGFSFLPNGGRYDMGDDGGIAYYSAGYEGKMWSSTEEDPGIAFMFQFGDDNKLTWIADPSQNAFGVRCLATSGASGKSSSSEGSVESSGSSSSTSQETTASSSSAKSSSSTQSSSSSFNIETYLNPNILYGEITDDRDGKVYKTVKVGDQLWMAQNLNFESENSYCYDDNPKNCDKYGRLYTWGIAMDSAGTDGEEGKGCGYKSDCSAALYKGVRGVCPKGFHLPSPTEWNKLILTIGAYDDEKKMGTIESAKGGWNSSDATNEYGLSFTNFGSVRNNRGKYGTSYGHVCWTSAATNEYTALIWGMNGGWIGFNEHNKDYANYVRCIGDNPIVKGSFVDERDGQEYKTIVVGKQRWMAQNLNYNAEGSNCAYGVNGDCSKIGRLYTWIKAIDVDGCDENRYCDLNYPLQGICPDGWHLPTIEEYETLLKETYYEKDWNYTGLMLKALDGWECEECKKGVDAIGFSAFAGPTAGNTDDYSFIINAAFWTATEDSQRDAYYISIEDKTTFFTDWKLWEYYVRCVENEK